MRPCALKGLSPIMTDSRSARRKERYQYLISLGFSPIDARRLRDNSGRNIEVSVKRERRRISRKTVSRRTTAEQQRLDAIQLSTTTTLLETRERRFMSRGDRYGNFSQWSSTGFPMWALERIRDYNRTRNLPRDDSFGHRRFYYWYVERIADFQNEIFADRGDSGIRNMRGIPLASKMSNKAVA